MAEFVTHADAICRSLKAQEAPVKERFDALASGTGSQQESEGAPLIREVVALARAADGKIAALPEPPADTTTIAKLLTGISEEATDLNNVAEGFAAHERSAWEAAKLALQEVEAYDHGLAQGIGLGACEAEGP